MAANAQRDLSMLNIGKQCTHPKCYLVDFLPFKCDHCEQTYCGDHFMPLVHNCEKYDESKHNRIAPPCPFCATPIAIPPGQDPNVRMDRHFNEDCSVLTGKSGKSSSAPHCARPKCGKVLFSPIPCDKCKQQFCPQHRFPDTHSCATSSTNLKASASSSSSPSSRPMQPAAVSAAAMAAIKRAMNNTASSSATAQKQPQTQTKATPPQTKLPPSTSVKSNASASPSRSNPFSAADRRAKAERESRLKAMQERAKKGLLSEEEKVLLAAAQAEKQSDKDGCIIG